jgi:hypothetical protein
MGIHIQFDSFDVVVEDEPHDESLIHLPANINFPQGGLSEGFKCGFAGYLYFLIERADQFLVFFLQLHLDVIAFVEVDHNFEEALSALELLPMIAGEGSWVNGDIVATIFIGVEQFGVDLVVLGEALINGRYQISLK